MKNMVVNADKEERGMSKTVDADDMVAMAQEAIDGLAAPWQPHWPCICSGVGAAQRLVDYLGVTERARGEEDMGRRG